MFSLCFDGSGLNYFGFKKSNGLALFFISFTHIWAFFYLFFIFFIFLMRLKCGLLSLSWFEWKFDLNMGCFIYFYLFLFRILSILIHTEREKKVLKKLTVMLSKRLGFRFINFKVNNDVPFGHSLDIFGLYHMLHFDHSYKSHFF